MATKRKTLKRKPARKVLPREIVKVTGRGRAERLQGAMSRVRAAGEQVVKETDAMFLDGAAVSRTRAFAKDILLGLEVYEEVNWP